MEMIYDAMLRFYDFSNIQTHLVKPVFSIHYKCGSVFIGKKFNECFSEEKKRRRRRKDINPAVSHGLIIGNDVLLLFKIYYRPTCG